ncbi:transferase hexapeptide (six repeat-containing protein) [Halovenus aranensis]|uniref:Transferase hexapeptide (Six repeat-containing protein) n=1 Tax=Halovenus aranensis TaxID=890420 RepID=A0A1G8SC83_9EURY|nr:hypothetical protein [Halovenus aranensis]SDJ26300.1 transferase hexapeptide (six repeat-containing protein) [Halovenus aranensis]
MVEMKQVGTNVIAEDFEHGENFEIGHFNVIHPGCEVGDDVQIRSHVELRPDTTIGDGCYIDSNVRSSGENEIGDDVTLRYGSIIARGCDIRDGCYICPQVMTNNLNHNRNPVGGATVGENCFIGTQTVLGAGIEIVPEVTVGSCSLVTKDITEEGVYVGTPVEKM